MCSWLSSGPLLRKIRIWIMRSWVGRWGEKNRVIGGRVKLHQNICCIHGPKTNKYYLSNIIYFVFPQMHSLIENSIKQILLYNWSHTIYSCIYFVDITTSRTYLELLKIRGWCTDLVPRLRTGNQLVKVPRHRRPVLLQREDVTTVSGFWSQEHHWR